jgi:hypothetical protein
MPSTLPTLGTVSYNGYTFPNTLKSELVGTPQPDSAGRTTAAVAWKISMTWVIYEPSSGAKTDTTIADIRQRLTTQGATLTYTNHGPGPIVVNSGATSDVAWGPKPGALRLTPFGADRAWLAQWEIEWLQPECSSAVYGGIMEYNWSASSEHDAGGYSTVTVDGHLTIALTRLGGGRTRGQTADDFRERVSVPTPEGFQRTSARFSLSEDKRRLDFSFSFREIGGGGLPYYTVGADGTATVRSQNAAGAQWLMNLSASYTVHRKAGKNRAFQNFMALFRDRTDPIRQAGKLIQLIDFTISEGLYDRGGDHVSFDASYTFLASLRTILQESGMWRPVPNTNWRQWKTSIQFLDDNRGIQNVSFPNNADVIVDLCGGTPAAINIGVGRQPPAAEQQGLSELTSGGWIHYENHIQALGETGLVAHQPLPKDQSAPKRPGDVVKSFKTQTQVNLNAAQLSSLAAVAFTSGKAPDLSGVDRIGPGGKLVNTGPSVARGGRLENGMIMQKRTDPAFRLRMVGYGVAAGFRVPCPEITTYEGKPVVIEGDQYFTEYSPRQLCGVPVFVGIWDIPYLVVA